MRALAVDVPARRINEIVDGQRRITAHTALRLSRAELDGIRPLSAASKPN